MTDTDRGDRCPFCGEDMGPLVVDAALHIGGSHADRLREWLDGEWANEREDGER